MTLGVFFAVIFAALLHACWNALVKLGPSKISGMLAMTMAQGAGSLIVALLRPFPNAEVWPWLLATGVVHSAYKLFLTYAYEQGDLSRVYPIARGAAPMIVLVVSSVFLIDALSIAELVGIAVLGLGIFLMARGVFSSGESRRLLPFALGSAVATASYSLLDGLGARISGDPVTFVAWMFALDAFFFLPIALLLRGPSIFRADAKSLLFGIAGAAFSFGAYVIAVWAMTVSPIALVTALRETSILFAVLIGWLVFKEPMDRNKAVAAALIVLGVMLTRIV